MLNKFKIGNYNTDNTGVTVIIAEEGATGGVSVRGASPATRETDLLKDGNSVDKVNAVVLSGGSAFGLEAACGVMEYLKEKGFGYNAGKYNVPIVVGASIYDLEKGEFDYPDKEAGYKCAFFASSGNLEQGKIGGGKCATVGKALGMACAEAGGLGVAQTKLGKIELAVISVVNPLGDVVDEKCKILAGAKVAGVHVGTEKAILTKMKLTGNTVSNTTISCILTNATFTKTQLNKLCDIAHDGYAQAIRPSHTQFDGDAIFGLASGEVEGDYLAVAVALPGLVAEAVRNAVK